MAKKNRVVIQVTGGVLDHVVADEDVELIIMDWDNFKEAESVEDLDPEKGSPDEVGEDKVDAILAEIDEEVKKAKEEFEEEDEDEGEDDNED